MPVGNVEDCITKRFFQGFDYCPVFYYPNDLADPVIRREIIFRFNCHCPRKERSFFLCILVKKENLPGIRIDDIGMGRALTLLVFACQLMLLYNLVLIIINTHTGYQTRLLPTFHNLRIKIKTGRGVLYHYTLFDHVSQMIFPVPVEFMIITLLSDKTDFWLRHVEKTDIVPIGYSGRFFYGNNVIGQNGNP